VFLLHFTAKPEPKPAEAAPPFDDSFVLEFWNWMVEYCGMGTEFTVDPSQKLVHVSFDDQTTAEEFLGYSSLIRSHPDFDPGFSVIIDCSKVTGNKFPVAVIEQLARQESVFSPTSMHVIIAPKDHIYGLARMGQVFGQQTKPNTVVVRTTNEAFEVLSKVK
jgi:hypothetical protein